MRHSWLGDEVDFQGTHFRVMAIARNEPGHFVTYIWRNGKVSLYDDNKEQDRLQEIAPIPERFLPSNRAAVFLGRIEFPDL